MSHKSVKWFGLVPHILALMLAMLFSWHVSQSQYSQTGLQFAAPVLIIMLVHFIWIVVTGKMVVGFANRVYLGSVKSIGFVATILVVLSVYTPKPAQAGDLGTFVISIGAIIFCLAIIVLVCFLLVLIVSGLFRGARFLFNVLTNRHSDNNSRLFDFGGLLVGIIFLSVASLEGVYSIYEFEKKGFVTSTHFVNAPGVEVWRALETATSPKVPLDAILRVFPQPVQILKD